MNWIKKIFKKITKKNKKPWLYWVVTLATALTVLGTWSHLTTAFSIYELKDSGSGKFSNTMTGRTLASAVSFFLIFTAIGITYLEAGLKKSKSKQVLKVLTDNLISLRNGLYFIAYVEMFGNVYYSLASHTGEAKFVFKDLTDIDLIAWISILTLSGSLTYLTILGSKLMSIFSLPLEIEEAEQAKEPIKSVVQFTDTKTDDKETGSFEKNVEDLLNKKKK